ncbi:translocation/assembly module TamB domain-containing protein [Rhizobium alvei]|uniref:Translocation/assembly module TamB domain-containing protein n=1 Tax=Rhizobium alvei TaxID=1132659 RepID=A0ABT8YHA4_9HYPH|nr:translocation/assembly module TamB domain-containing protein [Rhizobium alvei]MDO6963060.1 translocation/assembly module TamB domain-containing protein [Rhizobium alvei]
MTEAPKPSLVRKIILRSFATLAGLLALLVAFLAFVAATGIGSQFLAGQAARLASSTDLTITIEGTENLLGSDTRVKRITLADTKGPFAEIEGVAIDWSLRELLTLRFHATDLVADSIRFDRLPVTIEPSQPSSGEFSLPVEVKIDRIELARIVLGKELVKQETVLALAGSAQAVEDRISAQITALQAERPEAQARIDLDYRINSQSLTANASISEPKNGIIARLLALPGLPPVAIDIAGKGPLSDWSGTIAADVDAQRIYDAEFRHALVDTGLHTIVLKGDGQLGALMPPDLKSLFAGRTLLNLEAGFDANGLVTITSGEARNDSLILTAGGTLDPNGAADLLVKLEAPQGEIDFGWTLASGSLAAKIKSAEMRIAGTYAAATLDASATIGSLALPQGTFGSVTLTAKSGDLDLGKRTGTIEARLTAADIAMADPALARLVAAPAEVRTTLRLGEVEWSIDRLALESPEIGGTLAARFIPGTQALTAQLKTFVRSGAILPADLAARAGETVSLSAELSGTLGEHLALSNATVKSGLATIDATGSLDGDSITLDLKGTVPELAALSPTLAGKADLVASLSGSVTAPDLKLELAIPEGKIAGQSLQALTATIAGKADANDPRARLDLTASLAGQAITGGLDLVRSNGALNLSGIVFEAAPNRITGALSLDDAFKPKGQFDLALSDLGRLAALVGVEATGALSGKTTIEPAKDGLSVNLAATGETISSAGVTITKPDLALVFNSTNGGTLTGQFQAKALSSAAGPIDNLTLKLEGALAQINYQLDATYDQAPVTLAGTIRNDADGQAIEIAQLSATPRGIPVALELPAIISIKEGVTSIDAFALAVDSGSLTLAGTAGKDLNLTAKLDHLPAAIANRFAEGAGLSGTVTASATITGPASKPEIRFTVGIPDLGASALGAAGVKPLDIKLDGGLADNRMQFKATATNTDALALSANGTIGLESGNPADIALTGQVPLNVALASLDTRGRKIAGRAEIAATLKGPIASATLAGKIRTDKATDAELGDFGLTADLGGQLPDRFQLDSLSVRTNAFEAAGKAGYAAGDVSADIKGRLSDIRLLLPDASGAADFTLSAAGKLPALPVTATVLMQDASLAGRKVKDLTVRLDGVADSTAPTAKITVNGSLDGQVVDIAADVVGKQGQFSLPSLSAKIGKNTASGAIALGDNFLPAGKVSFNLPDIGLLAALAAQKASGDLAGEIDIASSNNRISATVKASGKGIEAAGARIDQPRINLVIEDIAAGRISGTIAAKTITSGENRIGDLALAFDRAGNQTGFDLKSLFDGKPLTAKGSLNQTADGLAIALDAFQGTPRKIPVRLQKPTVIQILNGGARLDGLSIEAGKGNVTVSGTAGDRLDLKIGVRALPLSLANIFSPGLGAEGSLDASITAKGSAAAPSVSYDVTLKNVAASQTKSLGLKAFAIGAKGKLENNVVSVVLSASNPDRLQIRLGGTAGLAKGNPLNLTVDGTLPFAVASGILAQQGIAVKGDAKLALKIAGAAADPQISGTISTSGSELTVIRQNLVLEKLNARVALTGKQATIEAMTANLRGGGSVAVSGTVGFAPGSGFPANLAIKLDNAVYTDGKLVASKLSGDLKVTGNLLAGPRLGGTINIARADITIPEKLPSSLAQIKVKHKNASPEIKEQARELAADRGSQDKGKESSGLVLDLKISAPRKIFVRGRGLDAELGGDVTITGSSAAPNVSGGFTMRRGRLAIAGKRLDFSSGTISFGGGMLPELNLVATSTVSSTTVSVTVSGLADNPAFTFSSSPALPQDEVLAMLIFGRTSTGLSPVQIAILADAVATLSGGQSNSLFNKLRQGLGVDNLDVGTDDSGKASVTAGKYLNNRTYLELKQESDNSSKAAINLDIGKGVKLRGEAGSDGSAATGIFYEKEY